MQETLLDELANVRRLRLHGEIAEALERQYGDRASERAPRLAQHYVESATLNRDHVSKAVEYSRLAGEQAERQAAWPEAVRHYAAALSFRTPETVEDAALLVASGRSCRYEGDYRGAWQQLSEASQLYRAHADAVGLAHAVAEIGPIVSPVARLHALADEALAVLGDADAELRAVLLAYRARGGFDESSQVAADMAAELSRQHHFPAVEAILGQRDGDIMIRSGRIGEGFRAYMEARTAALRGGLQSEADLDLNMALGAIAIQGDLDETTRVAGMFLEEDASQSRMFGNAGAAMLGNVGFLREEPIQKWDRATNTGSAWRTMVRGDVKRARDEIDSDYRDILQTPQIKPLQDASLAILHLADRNHEEARRFLEAALQGIGAVEIPVMKLSIQLGVAETTAALGDPDATGTLYEALAQIPQARCAGMALPSSADRVRGVMALSLGLLEEAEQWMARGLEWCERERCPVEAGRCLQGLAEVAERRGEREQALEYLDRAGELFSRHGAKLYLEQVLTKKAELRS